MAILMARLAAVRLFPVSLPGLVMASVFQLFASINCKQRVLNILYDSSHFPGLKPVMIRFSCKCLIWVVCMRVCVYENCSVSTGNTSELLVGELFFSIIVSIELIIYRLFVI